MWMEKSYRMKTTFNIKVYPTNSERPTMHFLQKKLKKSINHLSECLYKYAKFKISNSSGGDPPIAPLITVTVKILIGERVWSIDH